MQLTNEEIQAFHEALWDHYAQSGRDDLPWRRPEKDDTYDPYKIMVSEIMLQQTQVTRVIPKYNEFLLRFPSIKSLADAELADVLRIWQGLGYNRRAKFLWLAAEMLQEQIIFPNTMNELVKLPGIGKNTAGAILAYAYNQPIIFIETNIRTVYIYHFFADRGDVTDTEIESVLAQSMPNEMPRDFYWALMDYGSYLKTTVGNLSRASKHFTRQSTFYGSRRQLRGYVLRTLCIGEKPADELSNEIRDDRLESVLKELISEGLIRERNGFYNLG